MSDMPEQIIHDSIAAVVAERDAARADLRVFDEALKASRAERDLMRSIVEAAQVWRAPWTAEWLAALAPEKRRHSKVVQLIDAVDTYRAAQKAPGMVDPADLAIPDLTDDERQAFLAAAQKAPTGHLSATQGDERGEVIPEWERELLDRQKAAEAEWTGAKHADPPGLAEATDAARKAFQQAPSTTFGQYAAAWQAAVRAAAPILIRAALLEAGDAVSRVGFLWARCWLDADGKHVWLYHRCTDGETVTMLPWPTWQAIGEDVLPSISCGACELHFFAKIGDPMVRADRIGGGQ